MFDFPSYSFIFLFGLCVGSFLNCIIYRLKTGESILFSRSHCPMCGAKLKAEDLIPLFSFLFLKGKCRYCHKKISWQYPLVELFTAILFVLVIYRQPPGFSAFLNIDLLSTVYYLLITCFLIVIFVYDLKHYIIPDEIIYPAIIITFSWRLFKIFQYSILNTQHLILNPLLSAVLSSALFVSVILITKGKGMGWGDVKIAFLMGLFLGCPNVLVALFFSFLSGALVGSLLIILKKKNLKSELPFGPFLVFGTYIAFLWGSQIFNFYLNLC